MTKQNLIIFFVLLVCNIVNAQDSIPKFEPKGFDFTTYDLKYYKGALQYWEKFNKDYVKHFPQDLDFKNNKYEFLYNPRFLQGGSNLYLKIQFPDSTSANSFYSRIKKSEIDFNTIKELDKKWYCYPNKLHFKSGYSINDSSQVRLFYPTWCLGKGDRKLGGITTGITYNKEKNIVVCWAKDAR